MVSAVWGRKLTEGRISCVLHGALGVLSTPAMPNLRHAVSCSTRTSMHRRRKGFKEFLILSRGRKRSASLFRHRATRATKVPIRWESERTDCSSFTLILRFAKRNRANWKSKPPIQYSQLTSTHSLQPAIYIAILPVAGIRSQARQNACISGGVPSETRIYLSSTGYFGPIRM